ncbi:sulfotransferase domain-containing protein [Kytococcus sedentarius]|uniref:Sulfotransferase family protein n=1 Tax=Kytococcus sedentarius (strain ATCC 14392 / DSM 20547 / JCM 11482 / CCUG 33030 / NBRC 15357 / NCTC 11040 / CCM 314 / 541) TaxID=478801 RepID=C7NJT6_KYTSD|nr:sulfotransferase domain-containing protein [Kytococcus sedentarius]ACV06868.1 sulfotransferase family protein [Kytococcus sedentarius DSM 20547]QQB62886.1 sulfotransferase domain-containing protein [Kytococcus sedentarius]STX14307.1 Sulfotransferase domain [Kytococcus sedentarius]
MTGQDITRQLGKRTEEQLRRAAAEGTRRIALRFGDTLPMWLGCGFPKSGTVWLCQLMGTYLGVPYPRDYRLPIAMSSVIHSHWAYRPEFPTTAYIARDGRDVMVSTYFYYTRALTLDKSPRRKEQLTALFHRLYGPSFDPAASRENMATFVEHELSNPRATHGVTWPQHIADWWDRPQVHHTTYEALLADTTAEFSRLMTDLTGQEADPVKIQASVDRFAFASATGRKAGQEDTSSFQRKGIAGDWRNHFDRTAAEAFDAVAGDALITLGYERDHSWVETV